MLQKITLILVFVAPVQAFAWGAVGHRIVAELGAKLADPAALSNCGVTSEELAAHTNDPDMIWRRQFALHPDEAHAHFFHVEMQPSDWRTRSSATDPKQGYLVYRIAAWMNEAKKARAAKTKNDLLKERLYGLSHYLGDLSQPLHLHHDYDGKEAGVPGIHSQFETQMIGRFETEIRAQVASNLKKEGIPAVWAPLAFNDIVFDTAEQSHKKAPELLEKAKKAVTIQRSSTKSSRQRLRFVKKDLWSELGDMAVTQITLSARLFAHALNTVCR